MFRRIYRDKKVLVTGHTGFKGCWLTAWLLELGAEVIGFSKDIPTHPSLFEVLELERRIKHITGDIRNLSRIKQVVRDENPDFVFHLAAQAIVSASYDDPCETITCNTVGMMNVLEALRELDTPCVAVLITSDKCYDNLEWTWGYRENDGLGGKDIYSGSKGAAELVIKSYVHSFFTAGKSPVKLGIGRAGNVIGGGDWAKDRIVADVYRAWSEKKPVEIRSPGATRPWQHVLEPISGYLSLGLALLQHPQLHGEAFNFGPRAEQNRTVIDLIEDLSSLWGVNQTHEAYRLEADTPFNEAGLLQLNCDKALFHLRWESTLDYKETVEFVADWYTRFYQAGDMQSHTRDQLERYEAIAKLRNRIWTIL